MEIPDGEGGTLRVHHVDEGPADGPVVLLLHGEPSWSYLYRHMIPVLVDAGFRCVVPDLVGFGRSDKPAARTDYTYARHVAWLLAHVFDALDLRDITLVGQDWGGLLGLRLVAAEPDRFANVVAANTYLPTGDGTPSKAFLSWQKFSQEVPEMPIGFIVNGGCTTDLSARGHRRLRRPFPGRVVQGGRPPVPDPRPHLDRRSRDTRQIRGVGGPGHVPRPFVCAFSDQDPITGGSERHLIARIDGAKDAPHTTIEGGGHFLQEDRGPELAEVVIDLIGRR